MTQVLRPPTDKQLAFFKKLAAERESSLGRTAAERTEAALARLELARSTGTLSTRLVSQWIEFLMALPYAPRETDQPTSIEQGVYELPTGEIFIVKLNKAGTHAYAKQMVEVNVDRYTEADEHRHDIEFVYAPGAIQQIKPEHRMPLDRAKELTIRYGKCIRCGRMLKNGVSVERGIGPVCINYFSVS